LHFLSQADAVSPEPFFRSDANYPNTIRRYVE